MAEAPLLRRRVAAAIVGAAATIGGACGPESPRAPTVRVTGDTTIVTNYRPMIRDTVRPALMAVYGSRDATEQNEFRSVQSYAVGPGGEVYAYDMGSGIKEFAPDGTFRRWVAREGEGPEEVGHVPHLSVGRDGRLAVYDLGADVIKLFTGDSVRWLPRPRGMPRYGSGSMFFDHDDELWIGVTPVMTYEGAIGFPRPIYLRMSELGELVDTVWAPDRIGRLCPLQSPGMYRAGFWEDKRVQWFPKATWTLGSDGRLLLGCPRDYTFDVVSANGSVTRVVNAAWVPVRTFEEERRFHEQWWQPLPPLPDERPAYVRLLPDGAGRTWVWPVQASGTAPLPPEAQAMMGRTTRWQSGRSGAFDVYDREGRWLARVALPEGVEYSGHPDTRHVLIRGDTIWAVTRDEYDIPYIGRFEVDLTLSAGG